MRSQQPRRAKSGTDRRLLATSRQWNETLAALRTRLATESSGPKHQRLKSAIVKAIVAGQLQPGDQLPPEPELAEAIQFSLGTVRRCLAKLAAEAVVTREHGRGTFISSYTQPVNTLWHLRFLADDGKTLLPIYTKVLRRSLVTRDGPWSAALGDSEAGFVRIERAVNVDSLFTCYSDFYLSAESFRSVLDASPDQIERFGIRNLLAERFNVPTLRVTKAVRCAPVPAQAASVTGQGAGDIALLVEVIGHTYNDVPLSYLAIVVPPVAVSMDVSSQPSHQLFNRGYLQ